jgi:hypothetical protein
MESGRICGASVLILANRAARITQRIEIREAMLDRLVVYPENAPSMR